MRHHLSAVTHAQTFPQPTLTGSGETCRDKSGIELTADRTETVSLVSCTSSTTRPFRTRRRRVLLRRCSRRAVVVPAVAADPLTGAPHTAAAHHPPSRASQQGTHPSCTPTSAIAGDPLAFPTSSRRRPNTRAPSRSSPGSPAPSPPTAPAGSRWCATTPPPAGTPGCSTGPGYEVWLLSWLPGQGSGRARPRPLLRRAHRPATGTLTEHASTGRGETAAPWRPAPSGSSHPATSTRWSTTRWSGASACTSTSPGSPR